MNDHDTSEAFDDRYWRQATTMSHRPEAASPDGHELLLLVDNIASLCWIANADGYIVWYNRRWHEYCGTTSAQMEGWGWTAVHDPVVLPSVMERWTAAITGGDPFEMVFPLRGADGVFRPFLTRIVPLKDERGVVQRWFGNNVDISEQQRIERQLREREEQLRALNDTLEQRVVERTAQREEVEEQLRQSQKLEAVGQLTGGVAHDFNNLLTVIRGSADLLARDHVTDEKRARYIEAIRSTAERAALLTGQLLAFARRQTLNPELFDASASLREVETIVRTLIGSRIDLTLTLPDDPFYILADRNQFDTAIVNMTINARDAMPDGGRLTITTGPVSGIPEIRTHAPVVGDFVAVAITDHGMGIRQDNLSRIFEPFYTTKAIGEGTGLGLSQVFGFAKQSGGDIRVSSVVGQGTTFTLYLPRAYPGGTSPAQRAGDDAAIEGAGVRVLVVEDNEQVGEFAGRALQELGFVSVHVLDADRALRELAEAHDRYQLVFTDVVMPGMSGIELGREVRRLYPHVPVILTSGYSHVLAQNGSHGFELLHKPYSVAQLSSVLQKALRWRIDVRTVPTG